MITTRSDATTEMLLGDPAARDWCRGYDDRLRGRDVNEPPNAYMLGWLNADLLLEEQEQNKS